MQILVSNGLDPYQDRYSVGPDLGSNCFKRLSTDNKVASSKEKVKWFYCYLRDSSDAGISAAAAEGVAVGAGMVEAGDF